MVHVAHDGDHRGARRRVGVGRAAARGHHRQPAKLQGRQLGRVGGHNVLRMVVVVVVVVCVEGRR